MFFCMFCMFSPFGKCLDMDTKENFEQKSSWTVIKLVLGIKVDLVAKMVKSSDTIARI